MHDHRRDIALFRYSVIREAADPSLSKRERGELVRALAERDHMSPQGTRVRVSRPTLDRWIRAWRAGGFDALVPDPRKDQPRTPKELLELACELKREQPKRTAAHIAAIIREELGRAPSERTLQRHFVRQGLERTFGGHGPARSFGRFETQRRNELWVGDALRGPVIAGRKTYLFAFLDDWSRALVGYRWGLSEDSLRLEPRSDGASSRAACPRPCMSTTGARSRRAVCCGRVRCSASGSPTAPPGDPRDGARSSASSARSGTSS